MAYRRPVDEWGMIIQKQSDLNKQREYEERQNRVVEKDGYRKDLLFQQQLRDIQKKDELSYKQVEAQEVSQRVNYFKQQEEMKKNQEVQLKKQMADDYISHQSLIRQREQEERDRKYREEQEHLARVKFELEAEERRKKEARERWTMEQQQVLNFKREQENMKKSAEQQEKLYDLELMRQRKAREEQREQNYRNYYQKLSEHQSSNADRLNQYMSRDTKDLERAQWIEKSVAEQNALLAQKEEYERNLRQMNIRNTNNVLRQQMEDKERMRQMGLDEQRRQAEEHKRRIEESMKLEQERERQKRLEKAQYSEELSTQKAVWNDVQMMNYKLSENEKKLNRNMIDEKALLQKSAQQILKNNSSIISNGNSYEENMVKFFGSDSQSRTPQPMKAAPFDNAKKSSGQSFNYNRNAPF
ncbi:hypothetical protein SteCoe_12168 [Stentor coeruleus]|uniref:Trichohyalin-plectin-homology domain-containing protein n=1 Tax=Stentor coeruleus TaxID=5963 RepID=A0A1R2CBI2_9CILI|nr:hypothetical protein SteCoe_12168 [Stentor coeruleus]